MRFLVFCLFIFFSFQTHSQNQRVLIIEKDVDFYTVSKRASYLNDNNGALTIEQVSSDSLADQYIPLKKNLFNRTTGVKWIKLTVKSNLPTDQTWFLSIPIIDDIIFYSPSSHDNIFNTQHTGQLMPESQRPVKAGSYPFVKCELKKGEQQTFYIRLECYTSNYAQIADLYIGRFIIYSPRSFQDLSVKTHFYNALFFGALLIMIFYNFLLYIALRDRSYLLYVIYGCSLGLFIAGSSGYTYEFIFYNHPMLDTYVKFILTHFIIITYLTFSVNYLQVKVYLPKWLILFKAFIILYVCLLLLDLSGQWFIVYNLGFVASTLALIFTIIVAVKCYRKGYYPALYFIVANALFIGAGILYGFYVIGIILKSPTTYWIEHSLKIAAVIELALFSLGLASKFNAIRKELAQKEIDKEKQRQKIIEEKNKELEKKVLQRTAEIKQQQFKIEHANLMLEQKVKDRTEQLDKAYKELLSTNKELDLFIYKSSHDLKGPIMTLLGLCHLGKLETIDTTAIEYLDRLENSAEHMDGLLKKLIKTYEIKEKVIDSASINIKDTVETIINSLTVENEIPINFNIDIDEEIKYQSDPLLIYILFENLINNAIIFKDSKKNDSFIKIDAILNIEYLCINILDNGIGIHEVAKKEIFNMFYKGTEISKGSGLGLYQAKLITRKLNGSIRLKQSEDKDHTEFEIKLPFAVEVKT